MRLNGRELSKQVASYGVAAVSSIMEGLLADGREGTPGGVKASEFSFRDLFEHLVPDGREALQHMDPRMEGSTPTMEADVDTTLFSNITGQIIYSHILQAYEDEAFVFTGLIPDVPTNFLDGEKIAGMARIGDEAQIVAEGGQYTRDTFGEEYIETPATVKRGNIVSLTKEAIFADRTALILRRAAEIGAWLGVNKEKRLCDVAIGAVQGYKRNGVASDTYQAVTPWINDHVNALTDWGSVEASEMLFAEMKDPNTGEPISLSGMDIVCSPYKYRSHQNVVNATSIAVTNGDTVTESGNPLQGAYGVHRSTHMYDRLQSEAPAMTAANAKECWLQGNFAKAFGYMTVFPLTTAQAPQNSYLSFERDIVAEYKASERGVAAILDPRYVVRNKNA